MFGKVIHVKIPNYNNITTGLFTVWRDSVFIGNFGVFVGVSGILECCSFPKIWDKLSPGNLRSSNSMRSSETPIPLPLV